MEEQVSFLVDVVAALSIALAGGWLATRFGLSPIIGYVAAGLIISPFTPGFAGETERISLLAEIGVVLLLFGVGAQFSVSELGRGGRTVGLLALAQILVVTGLGYLAGLALGFSSLAAAFFGAAVALSSTTVMAKLLAERGEEETPQATIAITWAVADDFVAIVAVALLSLAASEDTSPAALALDGLKTAGFILGVLIIGSRVIPWVLERVAAIGSRELFLLAIAVIALGTAAAAGAVGIPLALGAFLAGLAVSESERSHHVLGEILPARDVFAVLFFVSIGMLIDPAELADGWHIALIAFVLVCAAKFFLVSGPLAVTRVPVRTAAISGALLAQSAEVSFVILDTGLKEDVISESIFSLTLAAIGASVLASPLLLRLVEHIPFDYNPLGAREPEAPEELPVNHAVVLGYLTGGRYAADILKARDFKVFVVDPDRRLVDELRGRGYDCVVGNGANEAVLQRLNLPEAWLLVVADPDPVLAELAVRRAREINPSLAVIARAIGEEHSRRLQSAGAREVVVAQQEAGLELARRSLMRFGVDSTQARAIIQRLRARDEGRAE
jgi:CPA2 family monovalent cation:H+ antiporter-2